MNLNEISVFIRVVQTGSFSKAAKLLDMPNSTVSHKISSLERRLGVTLLQRTTRKLNVTHLGMEYFRRCLQSLEALEFAEHELISAQKEPQGLLRVTAPVELGGTVLPGIVSDFTRRFPKTRVETLLTDRRVDLLGEGVDLAIRAGNLKDSTLISKKIGTGYFAPIASPKYIKSHGTPSHPKELSQHRCLFFTPLGTDQWELTNSKSTLKIPLQGQIITNDLKMIRELTLAGDGISLLPNHLCAKELTTGKLVRILPDWHTEENSIHFVYPAQKFVTPTIRAFIALANQTLKESFELFDI
ncbi:MAG: LysR family transcriptional regulator [Bdellovibrionales bacterium]|nr:LysR family transcriptional regulator [Bdellovibrionales bacterium]